MKIAVTGRNIAFKVASAEVEKLEVPEMDDVLREGAGETVAKSIEETQGLDL